jgi:hypothetical protein
MGEVLHDLEPGDVVLVDFTEYFRFLEHPAVIIEIDDDLVTVVKGTSEPPRKHKADYISIDSRNGGLKKKTYFDCGKPMLVKLDEILNIWGSLEPELLQEIVEKMENSE